MMNKYILLLCLSIASGSFAAKEADTTNKPSKVQSDASGIEAATQAQTAAETSAVTSAQASAIGLSTRKLKGNPLASTGKQSGGGAPSLRDTNTKPTEQNKSEQSVSSEPKTTTSPPSGQSTDSGSTNKTIPPAGQNAVSGVGGAVIATTVAQTSASTSSTDSAISSAQIFSIAIACF